jgi:hypothetical protein
VGAACLVVIAFLLVACRGTAQSPQAPTVEELCRVLGRDPQTDVQCDLERSSLLDLLEAEFPPEKATANDVQKRLGEFFVERKVVNGQTIETYAILRTLFSDDPDLAIFRFNSDGVLVRIDIAE